MRYWMVKYCVAARSRPTPLRMMAPGMTEKGLLLKHKSTQLLFQLYWDIATHI